MTAKKYVLRRQDEIPEAVGSETNEATNEEEIMEFEDILTQIGEFGLSQKLLFLIMIPYAFSLAFVYFAQFFVTIVPEGYWCAIPELAHLTYEERFNKFYKNISFEKLKNKRATEVEELSVK